MKNKELCLKRRYLRLTLKAKKRGNIWAWRARTKLRIKKINFMPVFHYWHDKEEIRRMEMEARRKQWDNPRVWEVIKP